MVKTSFDLYVIFILYPEFDGKLAWPKPIENFIKEGHLENLHYKFPSYVI